MLGFHERLDEVQVKLDAREVDGKRARAMALRRLSETNFVPSHRECLRKAVQQ